MNILIPLAALGVSIISHERGDYNKGLSEFLLLEPEKVQENWPPNLLWTNQKARMTQHRVTLASLIFVLCAASLLDGLSGHFAGSEPEKKK